MANKMLKIRAHHLLCIPRYYSRGYNKEFAERHKKVNMSIRKNPEQKVKVIIGMDNLCEKCPNRKGNICMYRNDPNSNAEVIEHDKNVLRKLKINENSVHTAKCIFNLSMDKIPSVKEMCKECYTYYKSCTSGNNGTGINNSFRNDLNK